MNLEHDTLDPEPSLVRVWALERLSNLFLIATLAAWVGVATSAAPLFQRPPEAVAVALSTAIPLTPTPTVTRVLPTPTATLEPPAVGLVAGHSGGIDPGAVCADGLREVDITVDVAQRTKALLEAKGYRVDILAEFDSRLSALRRDYSPRAFLAIHADSCINYASGYKVARASNSAIPQEDDRLVRCLSAAYESATQLPFHSGSITNDMKLYHGLNEINAKAPGAIIELGFLGSEHNLLKNRRDLIAKGVFDGLVDFLTGDQCQ